MLVFMCTKQEREGRNFSLRVKRQFNSYKVGDMLMISRNVSLCKSRTRIITTLAIVTGNNGNVLYFKAGTQHSSVTLSDLISGDITIRRV